MHTHEKIEIIYRTVADFYGISYRELMRKYSRYQSQHYRYRSIVRHLVSDLISKYEGYAYLSITRQWYLNNPMEYKLDNNYLTIKGIIESKINGVELKRA